MTMRQCPKCRRLIPSSQWERHRLAHHNATKPRQADAAWWRLRRQVLKRDNYTCQKCGRTELELKRTKTRLHVHHVNGDPDDNRMGNLALLCSDCHPRGGDQPYW